MGPGGLFNLKLVNAIQFKFEFLWKYSIFDQVYIELGQLLDFPLSNNLL